MFKVSKAKAVVAAVAVTTLLSATTAYAATTTSSSAAASGPSKVHAGAAGGGFKTHLDSLVSAGTLTQSQEDAIESALKTTGKANLAGFGQGLGNGFKTELDALVTAGTITSDQETAIQNAITTAMKTNMKSRFTQGSTGTSSSSTDSTASTQVQQPSTLVKTALDSLVTAGTITQDQETAVLNAMPAEKAKGTASGQTNQGRKTGFKNPLDALVTAGTITSDQETAIQNAITTAMKTNMKSRFTQSSTGSTDSTATQVQQPSTLIKTVLDSLVTAGTITQDQETAVLNAMPVGKAKGTASSRPNQGRKTGFKNPLDALVTAGTITSDQETAIQKALTDVMKSQFTKGSGSDSTVSTQVEPSTLFKTALDSLVTSGTITQDQETAVLNAMPAGKGTAQGQKRPGFNRTDGIKTALDALVTDGTITQAQETAVLSQ